VKVTVRNITGFLVLVERASRGQRLRRGTGTLPGVGSQAKRARYLATRHCIFSSTRLDPAACRILQCPSKGIPVAKANYKYDKRQRDMARQKKQEEKRQKKLARKTEAEPDAEQGVEVAAEDKAI
jgi:hypothetical protein